MVITAIPGAAEAPRTLAEWLERNEGEAVTERDLREALERYPNTGPDAARAVFHVASLFGKLRRPK